MGLLGELTSSIPGIDEAMCLGYIMKIVNQLEFSVVVFDTAPTGHTLRLLNLPSLLGKGLEKIVSLKARFTGILDGMNQNKGLINYLLVWIILKVIFSWLMINLKTQ